MSEIDAPPGEEATPGDRWPVQTGGDCDRCAAQIQAIAGGTVRRIEPRGTEFLGASSSDPEGDWRYHLVVVKDGRVYGAFTGRRGRSIRDYKEQFLYEDRVDFGF